METENRTYDLSELTAKNSDYVHTVTKQLMLSGKTDEEVKEILEAIIPQILEGQKNGVLARNLLGTPTEFAEKYKTQKNKPVQKYTNDDPKLMILDSFLLVFSLLGMLYGLMFSFQSTEIEYGLATLILSSMIGGLVMYQVHIAQSKILMKKEGLTRWQRFRPTVILMGYMTLWIFVTAFTNLLPPSINPRLSGLPLVVLAALVFGLRYFIKRKYNIKSAMTARTLEEKK